MKDPTLVAANQKLLIKTVRVGGADRAEAKQRAIVHFKKRGYQNIAPFFVQEVTA
jgi:putative cell wall-binding protein